jgi:hypothetical protein
VDSGTRGRGCDPLGDDTMNLIKKMRVPLFIIIVAIASLTGFTFFTEVSYSRMNNYGILMDAFNKTNAKFILGEVHINEKKVSSTFPDENDILNYVTNYDALNVITYIVSPQIKKYVCEYKNSTITLISRIENNEHFLSTTISQNSSSINFNDICNRLEEIYARFNIVPICISSISGEYQNVLSKDDTEKFTSGLLIYIKAIKVKSIITGNTLSVTGISPFFSNQSNIKDINFNLGVRSSAFEDKTYITLATPIIINEY